MLSLLGNPPAPGLTTSHGYIASMLAATSVAHRGVVFLGS